MEGGGGGQGGGAPGIITRMPSVPLNNGQGEEINRLSKYQTCSFSELHSIGWVTMATNQTLSLQCHLL